MRRLPDGMASDATAEIFAVAWRRSDGSPLDQALLWLYGVARRIAANEGSRNATETDSAAPLRLSQPSMRSLSAHP